MIAPQLSLGPHQTCRIDPQEEWLSGSFNVCVPVNIGNHPRLVVRLPFPHRTVSHTTPGLASEQIRGEAATLAWLSSHCPNVPIPRFWEFGIPEGRTYTALAQVS
jgi:hypothetical protein